MRGIICLVLATMFLASTTLEASTAAAGAAPGAQPRTTQKPTVKERILEVPPGAMVEVRLLNKGKVRGRLGEISNEDFDLQIARGDTIETQKIAFTDVKSVKKVEGGKAGRTVVYVLAGIGAFFGVLTIIALAKWGD